MLRSLFRAALWVLVLAGTAWVASRVLARYVNGPPTEPSREPWPEPPLIKPTPTAAWVEPDGTGCPPGHPVKAKMSSKLYHLPGMLAYERTHPDRCYATPEGAEEDGFSRAKR